MAKDSSKVLGLLLFSIVKQENLEKFVPLEGFLQYANDLLVAPETKGQCKFDILTLLQSLSSQSHKAFLDKVQCCQTQVIYLGHLLSAKGCKVLQSKSQPIL